MASTGRAGGPAAAAPHAAADPNHRRGGRGEARHKPSDAPATSDDEKWNVQRLLHA